MTVTSTNIGIVATNAPAKPLRREGIRCMKLGRGRRSNFGKETISAAGLSTTVAQAGVSIRPASAIGRDRCRLRRRHRSSRTVKAQHLQLALLNSRSLSGQRPMTRDKLHDLISYVRKLKINVHLRNEELQSRRRTCFLHLHWRVYVHIGRINWNYVGSEVQIGFPKWWFNAASRK